ncbi:hypothetical protein [Ohessyouella blattaphilus]|uniref:hypothetical protein n=1 Tax=Ohessyouella blattaphilus TaxID=2949333 RepID=UPI003E3138E2
MLLRKRVFAVLDGRVELEIHVSEPFRKGFPFVDVSATVKGGTGFIVPLALPLTLDRVVRSKKRKGGFPPFRAMGVQLPVGVKQPLLAGVWGKRP